MNSKLSYHDGYSILNTKTLAHSCDMVVKRIGYPDIRIESKAHGRDTGENVRTQEVKKFESDLIHLNNHGIFISLYSGICGKGMIDFEFIPTIKKFAFYLSRNDFDGDMICEIVRLIYSLDAFITDRDDADVFTISNVSVTKIKNYLNDFNRKIDDLKTNSKNSLRMLNELTLDVIEKLLTNENEEKIQFECNNCKCVYKSKTGLTNHMKKCNSKILVE